MPKIAHELLESKKISRFRRHYEGMTTEEIGFTVGNNIKFVVENALCHGCGTCYAVCPEDVISIHRDEKQGIYLPAIGDGCTECGLCVNACPGFELDLNELPWIQEPTHNHALVGPYSSIYRAHTSNAPRRERASSGGLVTEIVSYLLAKKTVSAAILVRMKDYHPLVPEGYIARAEDELLSSQKSKYCPVSLNTILRDIIWSQDDNTFVFVGLPNHVHGLRLAQRLFPDLMRRIPVVLSIFTAHTPSFRATEFILYKNKIDPSEVASIEYRGGGNPGRMRIVTKNRKEHLVPHLHWTYSGHSFPLFFYPVREWLYFDKMSELADISCGDNWMEGLKEQKGASTVIARTDAAAELIKKMGMDERIHYEQISAEDLVIDQGLRTKLNIRRRLELWVWLGRKIPIYTRQFEKLPSQTLRTLRFASYVRLCENAAPLWFMDTVIKLDYFLRAKPKRYFVRAFRLIKRMALALSITKSKPLVSDSKPKFVLIGGYGHDDIGDEAMPHGVRAKIEKKFGDKYEIVMLSYDPVSTSNRHHVRSVRDFQRLAPGRSVRSKVIAIVASVLTLVAAKLEYHGFRLRLWTAQRLALDEIASCSALINVGGGNLNSLMPSELYKKCTTYLVCRLLGKPVYISAQTVGPFRGGFDTAYARYCLNKVRVISFRDKSVSKKRLLEIGVSEPVMFDAADDAITLYPVSRSDAYNLLEDALGFSAKELRKRLLVVANLKASLRLFKGFGRNNGLEAEIDVMAQTCDYLVDSYDCNIIFVGTDFTPGVDDRELHSEVKMKSKSTKSIFCLENEYEDVELMGLISCSDVVIGSRYHFNVFAAATFTPFLGIASGQYQMTKLEGLTSLLGLPQCFFQEDMEYANPADVFLRLREIIDSRQKIRRQLETRVPLLQQESMKIFDLIEKDLHF